MIIPDIFNVKCDGSIEQIDRLVCSAGLSYDECEIMKSCG